jgi:thiol-disulfide isomerase/thioredoxin
MMSKDMRFLFIAALFLIFFLPHHLYAQWHQYKPIRQSSYGWPTSEVDSRLQPNNIYKEADQNGYIHEGIHGINGHLRAGKVRTNAAFYLGQQGLYALLKEPPITLRDISRDVPQIWRDSIYQLYLVQQRQYWNNEPLYILDEAVAYLGGAIGEIHNPTNQQPYRISHCIQFNEFLIILLKYVNSLSESQYSNEDKAKLQRVIHFHIYYTYKTLKLAQSKGILIQDHIDKWRLVVKDCEGLFSSQVKASQFNNLDEAIAWLQEHKDYHGLFVFLTAEWCGPCQLMKQQTIPWIKEELGKSKVVYYQLDVDNEREAVAMLKERGYFRGGVPAYILTSRNRTLGIGEGYKTPTQFRKWWMNQLEKRNE